MIEKRDISNIPYPNYHVSALSMLPGDGSVVAPTVGEDWVCQGRGLDTTPYVWTGPSRVQWLLGYTVLGLGRGTWGFWPTIS